MQRRHLTGKEMRRAVGLFDSDMNQTQVFGGNGHYLHSREEGDVRDLCMTVFCNLMHKNAIL